jgi:hypothetical protein
MWALGDPKTSVQVSAGGSIVCGPIDLSRIDLNRATLLLDRASGSGTLKVSGQLSHDGVNDFFELGDLITTVTTAAKVYDLSSLTANFGNYLTLTVTETGSASTANAKCYLMAKGV